MHVVILLAALAKNERRRQNFFGDPRSVNVEHGLHFGSSAYSQYDAIAYRESRLLSHTLYPTNQFPRIPFTLQLWRDRGVDRREETAVFLHYERARGTPDYSEVVYTEGVRSPINANDQ